MSIDLPLSKEVAEAEAKKITEIKQELSQNMSSEREIY